MKRYALELNGEVTSEVFGDFLPLRFVLDGEGDLVLEEKEGGLELMESLKAEVRADELGAGKPTVAFNQWEIDAMLGEFEREMPEIFEPGTRKEVSEEEVEAAIKSAMQNFLADNLELPEVFPFSECFPHQPEISYGKNADLVARRRVDPSTEYSFDRQDLDFDFAHGTFEEFLAKIFNATEPPLDVLEEQEALLGNQETNAELEQAPGVETAKTELPIPVVGLRGSGDADPTPEEVDFYLAGRKLSRSFPFQLDTFQKKAVYHIERGENVFVGAHTSAGKTVVAEYAIAKSFENKAKVIYTSPIKALSNQKFQEFGQKFENKVGILTGDVTLKPDANCLIMTTEILRNRLLKESGTLANTDWVIFDEVHYINNEERGTVWEETIILLPKNVGIVMLSATIENVQEFADWVSRVTAKRLHVIKTFFRPVPLQHFLFIRDELLVKSGDEPVKEDRLYELMRSIEDDAKNKDMRRLAKKDELENLKADLAKKSNQKERLRKITRRKTNKSSRGGGGGGDDRAVAGRGNRDEKITGQLIAMLKLMQKRERLPAIIFVFSKKSLTSLAESVSAHLDLVTAVERRRIHTFFDKAIRGLKPHDKEILQITGLREMLLRGVGMHHGDLLPICKEIVEILMQKGLVKLLFATDSFAMGLNMPTRSVIFASLFKHDGKSLRLIGPGEYTQMCGRAGRRGIDAEGYVYIFIADPTKMPSVPSLKGMMDSKGEVLQSKFKLSYSVIINSYRSDNLLIDDLMKKSFTENKNYVKIKALQKRNNTLRNYTSTFHCQKLDNKEFNIEEPSPIFEYRALLSKMEALPKGEIDLEVRDTLRSYLPVFVKAIDLKGNLDYFVLESVAVEKNSLVFVGAHVRTDHDNANIQFEKLAMRTKNVLVDEIFYSISQFKIPAERVLDYFDITVDVSSDEQKHTFVKEWLRILEQVEAEEIGILTFGEPYDSYLERLSLVLDEINASKCKGCSLFGAHFDKLELKKNFEAEVEKNLKTIARLEDSFDSETYLKIIKVLQRLKFIDGNMIPTYLMELAKASGSGPEVVLLIQLLSFNKFEELTPPEIAALLSVVSLSQRSSDYTLQYRDRLEALPLTPQLKNTVIWLNDRFIELKFLEEELKIVFEDVISFDMIEVVYEWASGTEFASVSMMTEKLEGHIIRTIYKIDKMIENLKRVYSTLRNPPMVRKMEEALMAIRRDILVSRSLYLTDE